MTVTQDGKYIAFLAGDFGMHDLVIENIDGTGRRVLVRHGTSGPGRPAFSADGQRVAYEANGQIVTTSFARGDADPAVAVTPAGSTSRDPTWGLNSKLAFASAGDIWSVNADGTGLVNLTNHPADDYLPAFSHDGSKIAFFSKRSGRDHVWIMNADGSEPRQVSPPDAGYGAAFDLTGEHLLYSDEFDFKLRLIAFDGTDPMVLPGCGPPYTVFPE